MQLSLERLEMGLLEELEHDGSSENCFVVDAKCSTMRLPRYSCVVSL